MEIEFVVLSALITIFSLGLLFVSLLSYRKYRNAKLLAVSMVFFIFFLKGVLLSIGLFYSESVLPTANLSYLVFDVIILLLLFLATLKR